MSESTWLNRLCCRLGWHVYPFSTNEASRQTCVFCEEGTNG